MAKKEGLRSNLSALLCLLIHRATEQEKLL
jgi:hypothetical protein